MLLQTGWARRAGREVAFGISEWNGSSRYLRTSRAREVACQLAVDAVVARREMRPAVLHTPETCAVYLHPAAAADLANQLWVASNEADGSFSETMYRTVEDAPAPVPSRACGCGETLPDLRIPGACEDVQPAAVVRIAE